jgi:hypothetical protein
MAAVRDASANGVGRGGRMVGIGVGALQSALPLHACGAEAWSAWERAPRWSAHVAAGRSSGERSRSSAAIWELLGAAKLPGTPGGSALEAIHTLRNVWRARGFERVARHMERSGSALHWRDARENLERPLDRPSYGRLHRALPALRKFATSENLSYNSPNFGMESPTRSSTSSIRFKCEFGTGF